MSESAVSVLEPTERILKTERERVQGVTTQTAQAVYNDKAAIAVQKLNAFYGKKQVLNDVSLPITQGQITALIGPSGCGKTTFLRTLNRMSDTVPGFRWSGNIKVLGQDLRAVKDVESFRRSVGMLFQRPNPFPMSIGDNVMLALKLFGVNKARRLEIAEEKLTEVGLWADVKDRLNQSPSALSGGQQQRLCLARALAVEPRILLLDEPASALDPKSTRLLEDLFLRLAERMTLVIVTHNLAQARRIADRTAFMEAGSLVEVNDTELLFSNPQDARTKIYVEEQIG